MKEKDFSSIEKTRWFYFSGRHHYGPFNFQQMVGFYRSGEIGRRTFVWRKGESRWKPLEDVSEFWGILIPPPGPPQSSAEEKEEEPSPPPLPEEDTTGAKKRKVKLNFYAPPVPARESSKKAASQAPSLPVQREKKRDRQKEREEKTSEIAASQKEKATEDIEKTTELSPEIQSSVASPWLSLAHALFILLCLSTVVALYQRSLDITSENQVILRGLTSSDYQRLENLRLSGQETPLGDLQIELASGYDGQRLWGSLNDKRSLLFFAKLRSQDSLVLSSSPVHLKSHSAMSEGVVSFKDWRVLQGGRLSPGLYDMEILAYPKSAYEKRPFAQSDLLKDSSVNPAFEVKGQLMLGGLSQNELAAKLKEWRSRRNEEFKNRLDFLEQSFLTLSSLVEKQKAVVAETFPLLEKGTDAETFEKQYTQSIAPILQGVIVELLRGSKKNYTAMKAKQPELVEDLKRLGEELASVGKSLAGRFSVWSSKLRQQKNISSNERKTFRQDYRKELNNLEEELGLLKPLQERILARWEDVLEVDQSKLANTWKLKPL